MILPHPKQGQLLSSSSWSLHPNILSYNISKPKREMKAVFIFLSLATALKNFITGAKGKGSSQMVFKPFIKAVKQAQNPCLAMDCYLSSQYLFCVLSLGIVLTLLFLFPF